MLSPTCETRVEARDQRLPRVSLRSTRATRRAVRSHASALTRAEPGRRLHDSQKNGRQRPGNIAITILRRTFDEAVSPTGSRAARHGHPCIRRSRAGAGKADRLVGQGLLQVRGRRALRRDQEVRGQDRRQSRPVAVSGAGHDSEDRGGARRRHAARCRLRRRLRFPGRRQVGVRRQAGGHLRRARPDEGQVPQEHHRDHQSLQRQDQEEGVLRVPA